ncbi:hypothetical protein BDV25DRAFT_139820 [Aspergillus avenaceus]|uniref:Uncharacterized protein n=1 Tax=Aspergillus avenaceus TaxID=36643 RepID=A0A5N6TVK8_ASPAV|nr:hypothetical protein BDV25DRAFT_139820 [Aspergillus avenaceus]
MQTARIHTNDSDTIVLSLYAVLFVYQILNRLLVYRPYHKALPWHILAGITELSLYYGNFPCSMLSVVACYMHSITSLILVARLPNGYPPHTRPSYQGGALMRMVQILYAYYTQDPTAYHDAVMPIHAFIYTRALIVLPGTMGPSLDFTENINSRFVYAEAVFGGALMSIGHCSRADALLCYVLSVHIVGKLTSTPHRNRPVSPSRHYAVSASSSRIHRGRKKTKAPAVEVPQIGHLPADALGQMWNQLS